MFYRLSRYIANQLFANNPNITDLSDKNRSTKVRERYIDLYDNQWIDAVEIVETYIGTENEPKCVTVLLQILMVCFYTK